MSLVRAQVGEPYLKTLFCFGKGFLLFRFWLCHYLLDIMGMMIKTTPSCPHPIPSPIICDCLALPSPLTDILILSHVCLCRLAGLV
ncbi:hypothetical protein [Moraxella lacunata]|uniref:hypothetical protein n=1 Tax=Moraxella lacunata TaxID=477 RepID=UPI003EDF1E92